MNILVLVEHQHGKVKPQSLSMLRTAFNLTKDASKVSGILLGEKLEPLLNECIGQGADQIHLAESKELLLYNVLKYTMVLEQLIKTTKPSLVIAASSLLGKDLLARLAARLQAPLVTDVVEFQGSPSEGVVKPLYAGKIFGHLKMVPPQNGGPQFLALRGSSFQAPSPNSGKAQAVMMTLPDLSKTKGLVAKGVRAAQNAGAKIELTEAQKIISGGRSLGNQDNFKILFECAQTLGAGVGASRAAVDAGYASHDMQVGQTGKTVSPQLYVACGISGAIQHLAGMRTSKTIVAINQDPSAPIFSIADFGIVGDLFQVVPELAQQLKKSMN